MSLQDCSQEITPPHKKMPFPCKVCGEGPCKFYPPKPSPLEIAAHMAGALELGQPHQGQKPNPSSVFTKEQQQAIVAIIEKWWSFKMASIETGKVLEMSDKLDMILDRASLPNPTSAEVQVWRARNPRQ